MARLNQQLVIKRENKARELFGAGLTVAEVNKFFANSSDLGGGRAQQMAPKRLYELLEEVNVKIHGREAKEKKPYNGAKRGRKAKAGVKVAETPATETENVTGETALSLGTNLAVDALKILDKNVARVQMVITSDSGEETRVTVEHPTGKREITPEVTVTPAEIPAPAAG